MDIQIITKPITKDELKRIAAEWGMGEMVKAVIDVERGSMAIGGELHADANKELLDAGSRQTDIWGINLYPTWPEAQWIEFTSLINIRPAQGNRKMEIQDESLKEKIREHVKRLIV